ncbi:HEPN domain-containing protein [Vulcanococcus limneticus Candia 3F8]|uniref:HEPN domain-containing protein n=2 Tax=Vulcanococcus limneticus TaxID=2170428 RepID=UPI000B9947DF|nr:HEPN domain-containing protein [Vulcanococcus limneticus]MCP9793361.1 HEPN domain-containing protein [Vulcanococcus limneticus MW73D5]MCP9895369.1 HEPN domain-containing protein [Vulcanococcus limneticus Candia 3F8]MCP9898847.1 HEPN domain-containing protein [Vulcanococcus limneticus Candia 3B3]
MDTSPMTGNAGPAPLVTGAALAAFTQRLAERFAPEQVILFGSQARGEARWDSDADILVILPFQGRRQDTVQAMLSSCVPTFPLDLHLRRPEEIAPRYRWGDPFMREALDHGRLLHGAALSVPPTKRLTPARNPVVDEWLERAERHWRMAELLPDLPPGYLSGLFHLEQCLETYLRAALIAQGIPSRRCRDLQTLSEQLGTTIPGWRPDRDALNTLTQAALAYRDPGEGHPEPSQDMAWAIAQAGPLRACLRRWFDSLEVMEPRELA